MIKEEAVVEGGVQALLNHNHLVPNHKSRDDSKREKPVVTTFLLSRPIVRPVSLVSGAYKAL